MFRPKAVIIMLLCEVYSGSHCAMQGHDTAQPLLLIGVSMLRVAGLCTCHEPVLLCLRCKADLV
jgi:hypothetical protein